MKSEGSTQKPPNNSQHSIVVYYALEKKINFRPSSVLCPFNVKIQYGTPYTYGVQS